MCLRKYTEKVLYKRGHLLNYSTASPHNSAQSFHHKVTKPSLFIPLNEALYSNLLISIYKLNMSTEIKVHNYNVAVIKYKGIFKWLLMYS